MPPFKVKEREFPSFASKPLVFCLDFKILVSNRLKDNISKILETKATGTCVDVAPVSINKIYHRNAKLRLTIVDTASFRDFVEKAYREPP